MSNHTFTGVFIPAKIWLAKDLIPQEKMMLAEIRSLSESKGWCYANNKHFSEWLGCLPTNVSNYIQKFQKEGMVEVKYDNLKTFSGRKMRVNSDWYHGLQDSIPAEPPSIPAEPPSIPAEPPSIPAEPPSIPAVTEIHFKYTSKPIESVPPAPAESSNLEEEKTESGLVAPPPAESPAPTHIVKTTGPENPGVIEAEGIALPVEPPKPIQPWEYPNAASPKELKSTLLRYAAQEPDNWRDNVLEVGRATNWTTEKVDECLTDFCAWQFKTDNVKAKLGQYTAGFSIWLKTQKRFDRVQPGASAQTSNRANLNSLGSNQAAYLEEPLF